MILPTAGSINIVPNDTDFRRVEGLPIVVQNDLTEAEAEA